MILAIDQSMSCSGIIIMNPSHEIVYQGTHITKKDDSLDIFQDYKHRCNSLIQHLVFLVQKYKVTHVICESPSFSSIGRSTRTLSWLFGALWEAFPELTHVTPTQLKKFATGKGNAKKEEMYESLLLLGLDFNDVPKTKGRYDLTDAYFLAAYKYQELYNGITNESHSIN